MTDARGWVAYVGPFQFPWGQAASRRMCGVASTIAASGRKVVVVCGQHLPIQETALDGCGESGVSYVGVGESPDSKISAIGKAKRVFYEWGRRTVDWLDSRPSKPSLVIVYGGGAPYAARLLRWGRQRRVPVLFDVVEWYDPSHIPGGFLSPFSISSEVALRCLYSRGDGVIAISSYLANHFNRLGSYTVRVPPTLDVRAQLWRARHLNDSSKLKLIYAGTPGKKDKLGVILDAVNETDPLGEKLIIDVYGVSEAQARAMRPVGGIPSAARFHGHIDQEEVAGRIMSADFSVVVREPQRFAQAGFPTKFVESLSVGTPVIANLTSDLGRYLVDGVNGLVVEGCSSYCLVETLRRALQLSSDQLSTMRESARFSALNGFDYRNYVPEIEGLFAKIEARP